MTVDYIVLANRFWKLHGEQGFAPGETHLYFCLLNAFNSKGEKREWPEEVSLTNGNLANAAGVDIKFVDRNRKKIEERGLIFSQGYGAGTKSGRTYRLLDNHFTYPKTYPKMGEQTGQVNSQPIPQPIPQPTPKWDRFLYIRNPNLNPDSLTLSQNAGEEILEVETEEVIQSTVDAEEKKGTPHCAAPPQPDDPTDEATDELTAFVLKLSNERRLLEMLSRLNKLRDADALTWIERFVTRQWGADNLRDRPMKDLIFHCQSWIEDQQAKQKRNEQQPTTRSNRQRNRQSNAEAGSEIDRLSQEYFGS